MEKAKDAVADVTRGVNEAKDAVTKGVNEAKDAVTKGVNGSLNKAKDTPLPSVVIRNIEALSGRGLPLPPSPKAQ